MAIYVYVMLAAALGIFVSAVWLVVAGVSAWRRPLAPPARRQLLVLAATQAVTVAFAALFLSPEFGHPILLALEDLWPVLYLLWLAVFLAVACINHGLNRRWLAGPVLSWLLLGPANMVLGRPVIPSWL